MDASSRRIRTPDQRLRVFVSSTLKELAAERKAARAAIERLHLAPVMFELGARPHPPRDLYRSYLEQSDVFVGLYGDRYGWVAPGEEVSGLADEYLLSPRSMPKLIYIREPGNAREPRLVELLSRIRTDDTASFTYFSDPRQLRGFLEADLATLLAERFDQSRGRQNGSAAEPAAAEPAGDTVQLPSALTGLVGREQELDAIERMLRGGSVRLLTLTGPGGIGKSRLAIAAAERVSDAFGDGVFFVDFSPIHDPALLPNTIAQALGVRDIGDAPLQEKLAVALRGRRILLLLDNVEQVAAGGPALTGLLAGSPGLVLLVTSRVLLRVSAERSFPVGPLELPAARSDIAIADVARVAAVALFLERARALKPDFELTPANVDAVVSICAALDGVPLALELAAAKLRLLSPAAILDRLDRLLSFLGAGPRDLPARQQTLRSTIEWSTQMLATEEKEMLATLGVFEGGFSLDAVDAVYTPTGDRDSLELLGALVDSSLVQQRDRRDRSWFTVLATVRAYAIEQLESSGALTEVRERHASHYIALARQAEGELEGPLQRQWMLRLTDDCDNLRAVERRLLEQREWDRAAEFAWTLYIFWWVGGHLGEVRMWMDAVLASGAALADFSRAVALYYTRAITFWQDPDGQVIPGLTESAELFRSAGDPPGEALTRVSLALALLAASTPDPAAADRQLRTSLDLFRQSADRWGEAMTLVTMGRVALLQGKTDVALDQFRRSLALAQAQQEELSETIALHHLGWAQLLTGDVSSARESFEANLELSARLGHLEGIAYGLEGLVATSAMAGDVERAGRNLGAAERLREESGLYNAPSFTFHDRWVRELGSGEAAGAFERARAEGRLLTATMAADYALSSEESPIGRGSRA